MGTVNAVQPLIPISRSQTAYVMMFRTFFQSGVTQRQWNMRLSDHVLIGNYLWSTNKSSEPIEEDNDVAAIIGRGR
jgi:hypothetical protein